jgi:hypothetical protein
LRRQQNKLFLLRMRTEWKKKILHGGWKIWKKY